MIGKLVRDEFTALPISRQRKYQLRMKRDNRCHICGEPAVMGCHCLKHWVAKRERQRKQLGCIRRNKARSYKLEAKAQAAARMKRSKKAS
jgi:hypothetical protein